MNRLTGQLRANGDYLHETFFRIVSHHETVIVLELIYSGSSDNALQVVLTDWMDGHSWDGI